MNKTQYDVLFKDVQTCSQIYFDQRKSKTWLFNTLYALYQLEPKPSTMDLIDKALRSECAITLANEWAHKMKTLGITQSLREYIQNESI